MRARTMKRWAVVTAAVVGAAVGGVTGAGPVGAAAVAVTTTVDGGAGSLRDAFAQASVAGEPTEIVLQAGATYVLDDCAEGDLDHTGAHPLTITGNGATIRQTCAGERVIESDRDLTVVAATVTGGDGALGGGIEADTAGVVLIDTTVAGNTASSSGGGVAAIRVTLERSTVAGNSSPAAGGGIWADQQVIATNSTVTGNTGGSGGGIAVVNTGIELTHATVAGNTAPDGANLELQPGSDELVSFASVVADGEGGADCDLDPGVTVSSVAGNVDGDGTCGFGAGADDRPAAGDVGLGPLGESGGPTPTRSPAVGSPLVDGVDCDPSVAADQRGVARPQGPRCDVGAVEVDMATPPPDDPPPVADPATPIPGEPTFTG